MSNVVATIAYDGVRPFHLSVPCLVFGEDRTSDGMPAIDFRVCAPRPNVVLNTAAGIGIVAPYGLEGIEGADIVIVPGWRSREEPVPSAITAALQAAHARGAMVVGLCLGAFPVAAAGLLDGRTATTHWQAAPFLAERYPAVTVLPEHLYVDHGDVITSAGVAAGLDCCIHIVRRRYGAEVAQRLARRIVMSPHRQGGQAQFIEQPVAPPDRSDTLFQVIDFVSKNLQSDHDLDGVAARAGMTRRTFTRRFQARIGTSFARWLMSQRLLRAQELLETTQMPIEEIATFAGFGSPTSLRQHFGAALDTTPTQYRRAFARSASSSAGSAPVQG